MLKKNIIRKFLLLSYPIGNFVYLLILAEILSLSNFGYFSFLYAISNIILIYPGYGIGTILLEKRLKGDNNIISFGSIIILYFFITILLLNSSLLQMSVKDIILVIILGFTSGFYIILEQYTKSVLGIKKLENLRFFVGMGLLISSLVMYFYRDITVNMAIIVRIVLLGIPIIIFNKNFLKSFSFFGSSLIDLKHSIYLSLSTLSTIGIYSIDKILLSKNIDNDELGKYSIIFFLTFLIANRFSDIYLATILTKEAKRQKDYLIQTSFGIFIFIFSMSFIMINYIYDIDVKFENIVLFTIGAVLMFYSDVSWWKITVLKEIKSSIFSFINGIMIFSLFIVSFLLLQVLQIKFTLSVMGSIFIMVYLVSALNSKWVNKKYEN